MPSIGKLKDVLVFLLKRDHFLAKCDICPTAYFAIELPEFTPPRISYWLMGDNLSCAHLSHSLFCQRLLKVAKLTQSISEWGNDGRDDKRQLGRKHKNNFGQNLFRLSVYRMRRWSGPSL